VVPAHLRPSPLRAAGGGRGGAARPAPLRRGRLPVRCLGQRPTRGQPHRRVSAFHVRHHRRATRRRQRAARRGLGSQRHRAPAVRQAGAAAQADLVHRGLRHLADGLAGGRARDLHRGAEDHPRPRCRDGHGGGGPGWRRPRPRGRRRYPRCGVRRGHARSICRDAVPRDSSGRGRAQNLHPAAEAVEPCRAPPLRPGRAGRRRHGDRLLCHAQVQPGAGCGRARALPPER